MEAQQVSLLFKLALAKVAVAAVAEAVPTFSPVAGAGDAASVAARSTAWLSQAVSMVLARRSAARDLGLAYYRLNRALRTGKTVNVEDPSEKPTIGSLRADFEAIVERIDDATRGVESSSPQAKLVIERSSLPAQLPSLTRQLGWTDDAKVKVPVEKVRNISEAWGFDQDSVAEEVRSSLSYTGLRSLTIELDAVAAAEKRQERTATTTDKATAKRKAARRAEKIRMARQVASAGQANSAARLSMNGARDHLRLVAERDPAIVGWARVSATGRPCYFCAMLISRGPVYKTKQSATGTGDGFHDGCYCTAIEVYSSKQFKTDEQFTQSRELMALWPRITGGLSGKTAVKAWRKYITNEYNASSSDERIATQAVA